MRPLLHDFDLVPQRRGELLSFELRPGPDISAALGFDASNFLLGIGQLVRVAPDLAPVFVADAVGLAGADGVEHPFRRVGVRGAVSAVLVEIVNQDVGIFADVTYVYCQQTYLERVKGTERVTGDRIPK